MFLINNYATLDFPMIDFRTKKIFFFIVLTVRGKFVTIFLIAKKFLLFFEIICKLQNYSILNS